VNWFIFANFTAMLRSSTRFTWLRMLLHPQAVMASQFGGAAPGFTVLPGLLGGILLVQCWADLRNMGSHFAEGQILATALVAGPLLGLLLVAFQSLAGHVSGQLFARERNGESLAQVLRRGTPGVLRLMQATFNTGGIWVVLGVVMLVELLVDDARHFFPGEGMPLFAILKGLLVLGYLCLNTWLYRFAYPQGKTWLLAALLMWVGTLLLGAACIWLIGLPLS
jgi:hypothetical protein